MKKVVILILAIVITAFVIILNIPSGDSGVYFAKDMNANSIEKVVMYLVGEKKTIEKQEDIEKVVDYLQTIKIGEENDSFDKVGVLGTITLYLKNGEEKEVTLVGNPYVSLDWEGYEGVYYAESTAGKEDLYDAYRKMFLGIMNN